MENALKAGGKMYDLTRIDGIVVSAEKHIAGRDVCDHLKKTWRLL